MKIIGLALLLLATTSSYAQQLFIVHPHKYYLEDLFEDPKNSKFVKSLTTINDSFCDRRQEKYWVFDSSDHRFERKFPLRRCGSKKLRSELGNISSYDFNLENVVVIAGLYFDQCVSRTYISVLQRFINTEKMNTIDVHFPLSAIITWSNVQDYPSPIIRRLINDQEMFLYPYGLLIENPSYNLEIYINGEFEKKIPGVLIYGEKTVRMHFWTEARDMLQAFKQ